MIFNIYYNYISAPLCCPVTVLVFTLHQTAIWIYKTSLMFTEDFFSFTLT